MINLKDDNSVLCNAKFDMTHQSGIKLQTAGALSELPTGGMEDFDIDDEIPIIDVATRANESLSQINVVQRGNLKMRQANHDSQPSMTSLVQKAQTHFVRIFDS